MFTARRVWIAVIPLVAATPAIHAQDGIPADQFAKLRALIRPHAGESKWRDVGWLTSLHDARVKAAAEGKPILLWSGGGAPVQRGF
jgi:hypothetical protein